MRFMPEPTPKRILVVDVGGTRVKLLATGKTSKRTMDSGPRLTPRAMVAGVKKLTADWEYDVVSLGVPAPVVRGRVVAEPVNLGRGWIGFDFAEAFDCPVTVVNDAAMQAMGAACSFWESARASGRRWC
jgi:predicted NBD/HSP70 family sugar kinase